MGCVRHGRPTAQYLPSSYTYNRSRGTHVLLRTGRGDVRLTPDEAVELAKELLSASLEAIRCQEPTNDRSEEVTTETRPTEENNTGIVCGGSTEKPGSSGT